MQSLNNTDSLSLYLSQWRSPRSEFWLRRWAEPSCSSSSSSPSSSPCAVTEVATETRASSCKTRSERAYGETGRGGASRPVELGVSFYSGSGSFKRASYFVRQVKNQTKQKRGVDIGQGICTERYLMFFSTISEADDRVFWEYIYFFTHLLSHKISISCRNDCSFSYNHVNSFWWYAVVSGSWFGESLKGCFQGNEYNLMDLKEKHVTKACDKYGCLFGGEVPWLALCGNKPLPPWSYWFYPPFIPDQSVPPKMIADWWAISWLGCGGENFSSVSILFRRMF